MKAAEQDYLFAEYILDGVQGDYPNVLSYNLAIEDMLWRVSLHTYEGGTEHWHETKSYLSPFEAAQEAVRLFLFRQASEID